MNILRSFQLSRDPNVNVANLIDELLSQNGDSVISIEDDGPYHLVDFHSDICSIDAFLRRTVGLRPGQPVATYRTNDRQCFRWFLAIIRAGGIAVPLNPLLSLSEVRRILEKTGIEILVTDKTVFERAIKDLSALNVETWIQADEEPETLDGFLRVPVARSGDYFRQQPSIPPQRSRYFIHPVRAVFPKAQRFQAARSSAAVPRQC
jgi:acyl-CoA synthetase (AMP-forming)/AMP-acid ligase II